MSADAPDTTVPDVLGEVRGRLERGEIDLFTCDVFDTLLWRPVAEPHDLFVRLGQRLRSDGLLAEHVPPDDFARGRREAERRARLLRRSEGVGWGECTLEEIWASMPARWRPATPGDEWRQRGLDAELELEAECLGVHGGVAELLTLAHDRGVTTVLVSDTYFSAAQLRALVARAGGPVDAVDDIVASSERRKGKHGGLLRDIVTERRVPPARTLHLGDNPIADIEAAEAIGAIGVRARVPRDELAAPAVLDAIETYSATTGDDHGITAAVLATLLDPAVRGRPDAELGAAVGGPLLRGFANWVSHEAADIGVDTIHCLLREGGMIADLVAATEPDGPRPVTVHASRWTMLRAAVFEGTPDELFRALARNVDFEPRHVVEAFGVDDAHVADVLGDRPYTARRRDEAMRRISADDRLRGAIVASSAELRGRVVRYLDGVLSPTAGRLVVCDVGWGGTIQEGLEAILRHEGRLAEDDEVIGLYLSISTPGEERIGRGASMRSYLPIDPLHVREQRVLQRTPELLEQLCTPNIGTLLDIDAEGRPETAPSDRTWTASRSVAQEAMRAMVVRLAAVERDLVERSPRTITEVPPIWRHPAYRTALLRGVASTLEAPTPELARTLSSWLHDDVAGGRVVPLADPARLDQFRYLNAADLDLVSMQEVFWLAGAAASSNPTLAAQLAAAAKGVDPQALCPPSSAGRATVAVYEPTAQIAVAVTDPVPNTGAHGWSLVRLQTDTHAVRAVRIDFGDVDHLVALARLEITFHLLRDGRRATSTWTLDGFGDRRAGWVGGARTLSDHLAAVRAGGHLVVAVDACEETAAHRVEVVCAFRATELAPADGRALLPSPTRVRAEELAQRIGRSLIRRGRAWVQREPAPEPAGSAGSGPGFSVVLPIYNSPLAHLERQLGAIRAQTYQNWECIVVDDGSRDAGPRRLAERFAADDHRFRVHARATNGGIAAATNDALDRASKQWIVFVDHDDVLHRDALEVIAGHLAACPDDDVVYTDEQMIDEQDAVLSEYRKPDFSPERLLGHNYFCHIVTMRRELVERIGHLDAAFEPAADREFNMRAAEAARSIGHVPEILYSWRAIPGSVALGLDEKSDVGRSVVAAAELLLAERGDTAVVEPVPGDAACVRIRRPAAGASVDRMGVDASTTAADVDRFLRGSHADVVHLEPIDGHAVDADGIEQLVALCIGHGSPAVGPRLVTDDGRLVSAGRVNRPTFGDLFQGTDAGNPGPWSAFNVTREVSSIAPIGAVLDRRAVLDAGGFDIGAILAVLDDSPDRAAGRWAAVAAELGDAAGSLDLTMAVLGAALQRAGTPALWSPLMTIVLPPSHVLDPDARLELAEQHLRLTEAWPFLADEPYSPIGVHRA